MIKLVTVILRLKKGVCTKLAISKGDMTEDDKIKGGGNYGHKS